jgi:hypothetical protein
LHDHRPLDDHPFLHHDRPLNYDGSPDHGRPADCRCPVDRRTLDDRALMHRGRACGRALLELASRTWSDRAAGGRLPEALGGRIAVDVAESCSRAGTVAFRESRERSRNCRTDTYHAKRFPGVHGILLLSGCLLTITPGHAWRRLVS